MPLQSCLLTPILLLQAMASYQDTYREDLTLAHSVYTLCVHTPAQTSNKHPNFPTEPRQQHTTVVSAYCCHPLPVTRDSMRA
jgi:hypothetical protein